MYMYIWIIILYIYMGNQQCYTYVTPYLLFKYLMINGNFHIGIINQAYF